MDVAYFSDTVSCCQFFRAHPCAGLRRGYAPRGKRGTCRFTSQNTLEIITDSPLKGGVLIIPALMIFYSLKLSAGLELSSPLSYSILLCTGPFLSFLRCIHFPILPCSNPLIFLHIITSTCCVFGYSHLGGCEVIL